MIYIWVKRTFLNLTTYFTILLKRDEEGRNSKISFFSEIEISFCLILVNRELHDNKNTNTLKK